MRYGYGRVSSRDQDLSIQEAALKAAGCELIRSEKVSGTGREGRAELDLLLQFLRPGDELVVTRIDRLARSIGDLQDIVRALRAKGVTLRATEQPIDTATAAGKCFFDMLGVFAEFETNLRRERQLEGIAKAKAAGVYKGRKRSVPVERSSSSRLRVAEQPRLLRSWRSRARASTAPCEAETVGRAAGGHGPPTPRSRTIAANHDKITASNSRLSGGSNDG
jgi:DNA invertase Pin-like site-specific DNA recombinase